MAFSTKNVWFSEGSLPNEPSGNTVANSAAAIGTVELTGPLSFTIAASTSVTTTAAAGFDALLKTDLVSALDTHISTTMGVDTTGNTVSYNFKVTKVALATPLTDIFLNDATRNFVVSGILSFSVS